MPILTGPVWEDGDEAGERTVRLGPGGRVEPLERPTGRATAVVFLRGLHNYHTHIGDAFLQGRSVPRNLAAAVGPGGFKHRMLAHVGADTQMRGVRTALASFAKTGTSSILDFREQGLTGVRLVRRVTQRPLPEWPTVRLLGRPTRPEPDLEEMDDLLSASDGFGLSSVLDVSDDVLEASARAARRARKAFAVHVSEARREPMERVLALRPDLLVHLCAATPKDLRLVASRDVPVAVCPSSNAHFRLRPPVAALHRLGARFHFGTDNAMLGSFDLLREAAWAHRWAPRVPDGALLGALTRPPEKAIKGLGPVPTASGLAPRTVALPRRHGRVQWSAKPTILGK